MKDFCCDDMKANVYLKDEDTVLDDGCKGDKVVFYYSKFDEYGIPVPDRHMSVFHIIDYCPWCGKKTPHSKREEWFERLWALGYESPIEDDIPEEYKSSEWYEKEGK